MANNTDGTLEYEASCQCGNVAYTVRMPPPEIVNACTCSICTRNGYVLVYIPRDDVSWIRGYDQLKEFRFHSKRNAHKFCPDCGSSMLVDPGFGYKDLEQFKGAPDILCLNVSRESMRGCQGWALRIFWQVRMMKDLDFRALETTTDGWNWKPSS
jgi:hypothetical protein